ncbi:MAG: Kef family K(+) transporter [Alphaproteobacteria bacterium]|nr:Kef family K(+) transporter [Alphaproteobacteria bacterium]MBN9499379.1 Kef family K(+) transporter [Alphaproteobacteria bacterium]
MSHDTPLVATIAVGLGLAFLLGLLAQKLRLPPIVGYLTAGIMAGPFTPGYVADPKIATELAEMGVILLMFGVGLHFSLKDLLSVKGIAVPGALGQIACAVLLGMGLSWAMGWGIAGGLVFGLALSVASTVVLLRALQERRLVETERGRIAVGWLIVEDLVMILTLVLLPVVAGLSKGGVENLTAPLPSWILSLGLPTFAGVVLLTAVKVGLFVATMLIVGRRLIPWLLHYVAHTGSRELFRLSVLAIAIGVAFGAAKLFDVSFALGAFFAGMILAESPLSHQAARETLPLRDAFAVLFFVSVGMLFDPGTLLRDPLPLLATIAIIILGKSLAAYWIVRAFGHSHAKALTISASLAQIGEFSFILAVLGVELGVLPEEGRDLIVAGAILSILANPFIFQALDRHLGPDPDGEKAAAAAVAPVEPPPQAVSKPPVLLVGHGRVGAKISQALLEHGHALTVIDDNAEALDMLSETKATRLGGGFANFAEEAGEKLQEFGWILIAIPDPFEAGSMVETARRLAPNSRIVARAHSEEAVAHLRGLGADEVLMAEHEVALAMIRVVDGSVIA